MATLEEIVVQLTAETSQLRAEMQSATKATEDASKKMTEAIKAFSENSSKNTGFFQTAMATMTGFLGSQAVLGAMNMVKDAMLAMGAAVMEGVASANAEENAMQKLATSMALAGNYSADAAKELNAFASKIEDTTGIADDLVISNMAVLSSLTKLDSQGLQQAQRAAVDLSSALGIDLDSATRMVAKGIEGNVAAFQKYGITIQQGRNETENFANVVGALSDRFGGAANGNLKTFDGQVLNLKNSFGNFVEVIGRVITNNEALRTVIEGVSNIFVQLKGYAEDNADALSQGLTTAINGTIIGFKILLEVTGFVWNSFKLLYEGIAVVTQGMVDLIQAAHAFGAGDFSGAIDAFKETGVHVQNVNDLVAGSSNVFLDLSNKVSDVGAAAAAAGAAQKKAFSDATPAVDNHGAAVDELANKFYNMRTAAQESSNAYIKGLMDQATALGGFNQLGQETLTTQLEAGLITQQEYNAQKLTLMDEQFAAEQALLQSYKDAGTLTETQYQAAITTQNAQQANARMKTEAEANKQRIDNLKSTFGTISSLSESGNKELAAIGKAAAIANATIDGYAAVQKALASAPPPFNFALAAAVGVATAANVAKISGVGLKTGIDAVPGIGSSDNFPAVLAPGERVVPTKTNEDLSAFLANQKNGQGQTVNISLNFSSIVAPTREQIGVIIEAINDTLAANASLRILGT